MEGGSSSGLKINKGVLDQEWDKEKPDPGNKDQKFTGK